MVEAVYVANDYRPDKNIAFDVPEALVFGIKYDRRIRIGSDLELGVKLSYHCQHCKSPLEHRATLIGGPRGMGTILECACGTWQDDGGTSPFSGAWYGGRLSYRRWTEEEREQRISEKVAEIHSRYRQR